MKIYCGIDGTNNDNTKTTPVSESHGGLTYAAKDGHVKRLEVMGFDQSKYFAGTTDGITGDSSFDIVNSAFEWVKNAYNAAKSKDLLARVYLSGFSRGGAAALCVGHRLGEIGIDVQEMYLFDAVDRAVSMSNSETRSPSANVKRAFHAMRDPRAKSRGSFSNCGTENSAGNLVKREFLTTHGGIGGWPNGSEKVKSGLGLEDWAYAPMFLTNPVTAVNTFAHDHSQQNIHESRAPRPTNVTPAQELSGMNEAWNWMRGNMFSTERPNYIGNGRAWA